MDNFGGGWGWSGTLVSMSFEDLPRDWATRPLTDPAIFADVIDLLVSSRDRLDGAVHVLLCGRTGRLLQPCAVSTRDMPPGADRRKAFDVFARVLADSGDDGGIVVAIARDGRAGVTDSDREWHQAALEVCREHGIRLLGVAVATPRGVVRLPDHPADEALLA